MNFITVTSTGWGDVVPELKVQRAVEWYGSTKPSLDELRAIADHYCRMMLEAKTVLLEAPNLHFDERMNGIRTLDRAINENAEFVARFV